MKTYVKIGSLMPLLLASPRLLRAEESGKAKAVSIEPLPWDAVVSLGTIDDLEVEEVIRTFSRVTGRNFIYDKKDVAGKKVTILAPAPLTVKDAFQMFQTVLDGEGLTLFKDGKAWRIVPHKSAVEKAIDTR